VVQVAQLIRLHDSRRAGKLNFKDFIALHRFLTDIQAKFTGIAGSGANPALSKAQLQQVLSIFGERDTLRGSARQRCSMCF
jgi:hypothetical protein